MIVMNMNNNPSTNDILNRVILADHIIDIYSYEYLDGHLFIHCLDDFYDTIKKVIVKEHESHAVATMYDLDQLSMANEVPIKMVKLLDNYKYAYIKQRRIVNHYRIQHNRLRLMNMNLNIGDSVYVNDSPYRFMGFKDNYNIKLKCKNSSNIKSQYLLCNISDNLF